MGYQGCLNIGARHGLRTSGGAQTIGAYEMTQTFVEILLLVPTALCAGFVIFVAGVIQGVMNDLDEAEFKRFLTLLKTHALRSPYAIGVSSITVCRHGALFYLLWFQ
jgi:hypothetical protein